MKTAATVLQEMMVKLGTIPEYECVSQSGPQHQATFQYRCTACNVSVTAYAPSKKEAKQEVAKLLLSELSKRGYAVPPPYGLVPPPGSSAQTSSTKSLPEQPAPQHVHDARSFVALLKEFCDEYKLPACTFDVVSTTGPPHLRQFTVEARVGGHLRRACAATKKAARQAAAQELYCYLRENLARHTTDFKEDEAMARAHEKAMERYVSAGEPQREDMGMKVSHYHLGLLKGIGQYPHIRTPNGFSSLPTPAL